MARFMAFVPLIGIGFALVFLYQWKRGLNLKAARNAQNNRSMYRRINHSIVEIKKKLDELENDKKIAKRNGVASQAADTLKERGHEYK